MKKKTSIAVFGCHSLIGSALADKLKQDSFYDLIAAELNKVNFTDIKSVCSFFRKKRPDCCIIAPIKEGGIGANIRFPAELIYQNLAAQTNIIHAAWQAEVKKIIYFASSCAYPKNCPQPIKEEYLLSGPLEETNEAYASAKIAGIKMCQAYRVQYGVAFISVIPATVYGPGDNFDLSASHVIPALIRKLSAAKQGNKPSVSIWGTGKPRREFIYKDDAADACLFILKRHNAPSQINIGCGRDISIRELAVLIKNILGFKGVLEFDSSKPDGATRRLLDSEKLESLGWKPKVSLEAGIQKTYQWYIRNY